ncbi:MAG: peroxiredoxin family protein [bacterium]
MTVEAQRKTLRRREARRNYVLGVSIALVIAAAIAAFIYVGGTRQNRAQEFAVNVGDLAPEFSLPVVGGEVVSLSQLRQRSPVLLFFYEGIMCQPCWDQMTAIERDYEQFRALGIDVVGITVDSLDQLVLKVRQERITLPVLADESARVSAMYDTLASEVCTPASGRDIHSSWWDRMGACAGG